MTRPPLEIEHIVHENPNPGDGLRPQKCRARHHGHQRTLRQALSRKILRSDTYVIAARCSRHSRLGREQSSSPWRAERFGQGCGGVAYAWGGSWPNQTTVVRSAQAERSEHLFSKGWPTRNYRRSAARGSRSIAMRPSRRCCWRSAPAAPSDTRFSCCAEIASLACAPNTRWMLNSSTNHSSRGGLGIHEPGSNTRGFACWRQPASGRARDRAMCPAAARCFFGRDA